GARARRRPLTAGPPERGGSPVGLVPRLTWSPGGRPAGLADPDGAVWMFDYYAADPNQPDAARYGSNQPPADGDVDQNYRGLLARVRAMRFPMQYPAEYGPPEGSCSRLAGPYQWLLAELFSVDLATRPAQLGLPPGLVEPV